MIVVKLFFGIVVGFVGHKFDQPLNELKRTGTPRGWVNMARSGIGVLIGLPVFVVLRGKIDTEEVKDYLIAFGSVAIGVAAGYAIGDK